MMSFVANILVDDWSCSKNLTDDFQVPFRAQAFHGPKQNYQKNSQLLCDNLSSSFLLARQMLSISGRPADILIPTSNSPDNSSGIPPKPLALVK